MRGLTATVPSRVAAAALLAAAPVALGVPLAAPTTAATCAAGGGVSVVVDYNGLGGGVVTSCLPDAGGDKASAIFGAAGHELTRAQRQPGFVCRVDAVPADDPCVNASPADAYWGLWWSNGTSGEWTYSSLGVDSLTIPDGGSVAFSWDDVEGSAVPSAAPPKAASASPSPTASPSTGGGTSGGTSGGSAGSGSNGSGTSGPAGTSTSPDAEAGLSGSADPSVGPDDSAADQETTRERKERRKGSTIRVTSSPVPTEGASASADAEVSSDPSTTAAASESGGLPVWVAPVAILVLALGAGAAAVVRRRSAS